MRTISPHAAARTDSSPLVEAAALTIWDMGYHAQRSGVVHYGPDRRSALLLFFHSDVLLWLQGREVRGRAHSVLLLEPHETLHCGQPRGCWESSWIACVGTLLETLTRALSIPANTPIYYAETQGLDDLLRLLAEEIHAPSPDVASALALFQNCLLKLRRRLLARGDAPRVPPLLREIHNYLANRYTERLNLAEVAAHFHLSPTHFCREFQTPVRHAGFAISLGCVWRRPCACCRRHRCR